MSFRILTKNGVDNLNTDGARNYNFNAGRRSGIVKGALNEGAFFSASSNVIALDTCELRLCGHRVVIETPESRTLTNTPVIDQRLALVAQVVVDDDRNVDFSLFVQDADATLIQNNLDIDGTGTYQLEIGTFVQTTDGRLINILRTADLITGGLDTGESQYWEVGDVETTQVPYNVKAEVDIDFNEDTRKYDFHFQIPQGQAGLDGSGTNPNLLINGDFRVNQRGQSSYSGAGYTVDGWEARNSGFSTTITSNGITITTTSNGWFAQKLNYNYSKLAGKTITISCKINGVIFSKSSILPLLEPSSQIDLIRTNNFGSLRSVFRLTYLNGALWSNFYNYANETFTIEYAKLEIGSIATPFSPKPYEEELAACQCIYGGIATTYSNPNLLINGDFRVNQRGESALTVRSGITQYTFDRWRVGTSGGVTSTLVKSEKGMSITNTGTVSLSQYFEDEFLQNKGKMATLSAKINGVVYSYTAEIGTSTDKLMSNNVRFIIATGIYNSVQEKFIRFTMYDANVTYNFEWVKLEIGSVATAFSPRPYAEELAMCQRYYQKFVTSSNYGTFSYCYTANNTNQVRFELDLPVKMRDSSTIKLNGNMQVVGSLGSFTVVGLGNTLSLGNRKILIATIAGTLTSWSNYFIQAHNDRSANIELDAEIY